MTSFTPISALAGGLLIGLAAVLLLWSIGRIAGVSGVAAGLVWPDRGASVGSGLWRALFLLGLVAGAGGYATLGFPMAPQRIGFPPLLLVASGLLVGYGTALAGGCTSGHGVCGLARLSPRSFVATGVFLGVAIVTTFVTRHLLGVAS